MKGLYRWGAEVRVGKRNTVMDLRRIVITTHGL